MINLAICHPNQNAYSETFIQAHRNIPGVKAKFYSQGALPLMLDDYGVLRANDMASRVLGVLRRKIMLSPFSADEEALAVSFKRERIGCVLAEFGTTGVKLMKVCKLLGLPLIVHFHGFDASIKEILETNKDSYKTLFEMANAIVVVSRAMEARLLQMGCPREKLHYITYGPNEAFFNLQPTYGSKLLVGIGRFVDKKAPYYTILAFKHALEKHPDAYLVIGGDGVLLNTCRNLIKYLGIAHRVELPGALTPEKFRTYLQNARGFVQHSVTAENGDMEGTPVAVLEASASALPVISTYHAGIPDVVLNEQTGLLVDEHDVMGMAENMCRILVEQTYAEKLGRAGRLRIRHYFSMDNSLHKLGDLVKIHSLSR